MLHLHLKDLVVHREALLQAYEDCFYKDACSKTKGPIEVMAIDDEPGKFQLVDGYHRLIQYLVDRHHVRNNDTISAKINDEPGIQGYYSVASPKERWHFNGSMKYGNLEDLLGYPFENSLKDLRMKKKIKKGKPHFESINFLDQLDMILESISATEREMIENAKPNTILTVYHGTPIHRLPQLLNGFDSTADFGRDYRPGKHRGLFITSDFELAKGFGGGAIIEIKVPAKFIHGTDWSGYTGREQEKDKGKDTLKWVQELFPNSFRPYMSYTMLATGEPQGLLVGVIGPKQITGLWIYERSAGTWVAKDREEFLDSGVAYNAHRSLDKTIEDKFFNAKINMADPNLDLRDFVAALAKFEGNEGKEERYITSLVRYAKINLNKLEEILDQLHVGGSKLGDKALRNIIKQILVLAEKE